MDEGAGIEERAVREALALLPDAQREVIVLHAYEGMTFAEIADVLGMSAVTVRVRAHRGYRRLRELLARYRGGAMSTGCTRALDSLGDPRALATLRPHLETAPSAVLSSMRRLASGRSGRLRSTQALHGASARSRAPSWPPRGGYGRGGRARWCSAASHSAWARRGLS